MSFDDNYDNVNVEDNEFPDVDDDYIEDDATDEQEDFPDEQDEVDEVVEIEEYTPDICIKAAWGTLKYAVGETNLRPALNSIFSNILGTCRLEIPYDDTAMGSVSYFPASVRDELLETAPFLKNIQGDISETDANNFMQVFSYACCAYVYDWVSNYVKKNALDAKSVLNAYLAHREEGTLSYLGYNYSVDRKNDTSIKESFTDTDSLTVELESLASVVSLIKEGKLNGAPKEEKVEEAEPKREEQAYDAIVADTFNDIMRIYETLYSDCFVEIPRGVLTSSGILYLGENGSKTELSSAIYAKNFYHAVAPNLNLGSQSYIGAVPDKAVEFLKTSSYPLYHLYNIMGVSGGRKFNSWSDFKEGLTSEDRKLSVENQTKLREHGFMQSLKRLLTKLFDSYTGSDYITFKMQVVHRLTTIVIVNEFKVNGMMSFTYHNTNSGGEPEFGELVLSKMSSIIGKSTGQLIAEPNLGNDCYKFLYVGDGDAYNKEILFAYKAYENMIASGTPVNSKNIILGKRLSNGMPYTVNLQSPQEIFTSILAGSGSGKGVLTLSILAGLFAAGHSVGYVDYKPDMSAMLWDMERKIGRSDCKLLAIDGLAGVDKRGSRPVRQYPYGYQGEVFNENLMLYQKLHLMPYLKTLQMSCVLAGLRARGVQDFGTDKIFFILDEAQQANAAYEEWCNQLDGYKPPKAKAGQEAELSGYDKAMERMKQVFVDDIASALRDVGNTTGRVGAIGYIIIGQATDPAAWKSRSGDWKYNLFGFPIGKTSLKLMGKGINEGSMYGLPKKPYPGKEMMKQLGYWTISKMSASGNDTAPECIKSYLVLNENDYDPSNPNNGGFAASLLKNISDETTAQNIIQNDFTMGDGYTIRESIGFYGLMKMLCPDEDKLVKTMSGVYNYFDKVLANSGIYNKLGYNSVEQYLYSANPESFFTVKEIIDSYVNEGIVESTSDTTSTSESSDVDSPDGYNGFGGGYSVDSDDYENTDSEEQEFPTNDGYPDEDEPEVTTGGFPPPAGRQPESSRYREPVSSDRGYSDDTQRQPVFNEPPYSANGKSAYTDAYTEPLDIPDSPFKYAGGRVSSAYAFKQVSTIILKEINAVYGGLDRIHSVDVANSGLMVINNVKFMPQFDNEFISSLPIDIKNAVAQGNIAELFYFDNLYKFTNLRHLSIESTRLAETRVRQELGIKNNQGWDKLFVKMPNLQELFIAGNAIRSSDEAEEYERNGRAGFGLKEKLMSTWNVPDLSNSWIGRVWNSKPAGWVKKGAGYTLGIKGLLTVATMFGPWGVLFGALTAGAWYLDKKNKR